MLGILRSSKSVPMATHYNRLLPSGWQWSRKSSSGAGHLEENETSMNGETDYSEWSPDKLIERVSLLEKQLREQTARSVSSTPLFDCFMTEHLVDMASYHNTQNPLHPFPDLGNLRLSANLTLPDIQRGS